MALSTDQVMEPEVLPLFTRAKVPTYVTRVPSAPDVNPETLARMAADLPAAATLLPWSAGFGAVGYGCTSGATVIGRDRVAALVAKVAGRVPAGAPTSETPVTDPLSALLVACRALNVRRLGLLTPYEPQTAAALRRALEAAGIHVVADATFGQSAEETVARIAPRSVAEGLRQVAVPDADAVFASCTNLRSFAVVEAVERDINRPAISSNSVFAWHLAALAGHRLGGPGRLFRLTPLN
ncbi:MAG: Asp/Glu racemase [Pseudomonadota bacterium]